MQHICTPEQWRPVVGFGGRYEVSSVGNVRSLPKTFYDSKGRPRRMPGKVLKATVVPAGYHKVWLFGDDGKSYRYVHRLMLEAFIGPCPDGYYGCHWDDDPGHNCLGNLRWSDPTGNVFDTIRNGEHGMVNRTHCPQGHPYSPENTYFYFHGGTNVRRCKICTNERGRRWDKANPGKRNEYKSRWRAKRRTEGKPVS